MPLFATPALSLLPVSGALARPLPVRPALSNPAPFGDSASDYTPGERLIGGPFVRANASQTPPVISGPAPAASPATPGANYADASETQNADPSQTPPTPGPAPVSLDAIRAIQVGPQRLSEAPMRVGNLDILAPLVDQMPLLGATISKADLNNVPGNENAPIENQFIQINRPGQPPIVLSIGQNKAWIDRKEQILRAAPLVVGSQIYLPVFSLAPLLGASTRLDGAGVLTLTPTVESVQVFPFRDTVAITIKTSKPLPAGLKFNSMKAAGKGSRLYIDFAGYSMGFDALNTTGERVVSNGLGDVLRARAGMPSKFPDVTRITLDLKKNLTGTVLQTGDPTIFAFVITKPVAATPPNGPAQGSTNGYYPIQPKGNLQGITIVLDAGHGGKDGGAHGSHTNEKDRTLDLILKLGASLRARGANVLFTRSGDYFVTLPGRADFANTRRADLFISIHNNASPSRSSNGTATYFYTAQSVGLAKEIHREMVSATGCPNRGIHQRRFVVIHRTWMPSVLLEVAFVSNPREEALLNSPQWCQRVADGVARGVSNYASIYRKGYQG